jgi:hypothetical protein
LDPSAADRFFEIALAIISVPELLMFFVKNE